MVTVSVINPISNKNTISMLKHLLRLNFFSKYIIKGFKI